MKKIILLLIISFSMVLIGCQSSKSDKSTETVKKRVETINGNINNCKYIKVKAFKDKDQTDYRYTVYDKNDKTIYHDSLLKDPTIEKCSGDVYCVQWGTGTGAWQSRFFDISKKKKSEVFETNYDFNNNRTLQYDVEKKCIKVIDVFNEDGYYRKFKITKMSDSPQPVKEAMFIDGNRIKVKFLAGANYKETSKVFYLNEEK